MTLKPLISRASTSGGRILVTAAAVLFVVMEASRAAAGQSPVDMTVREEQGVYTVRARFLVEQTPSVALTVLTDYQQIPRFMPDVRTSVILERGPGRVVVEQEAVSAYMLFSKRVHLVLEIEERSNELLFRDRCGRSFVRYEGAWHLSSQDGQTAIMYELTADPSFDVPKFVLTRLLRRDSSRMIERLQREIAHRATQLPGDHSQIRD